MKSTVDYSLLLEKIKGTELEPWLAVLPAQLDEKLYNTNHGDLSAWEAVLELLPAVKPESVDFSAGTIKIGCGGQLDDELRLEIKNNLKLLMPWRKGPFDLFGIHIDTEWRSDWKWDRLEKHLSPLNGRKVLDVGCGNGYHLWRMAAHDPELLIGVDPGLKYVYQFEIMRRYISKVRQDEVAFVLPFGIEDVPQLKAFDTVFSMGVFYHRRSPIDHLMDLRHCCRSGGELVLETLIIDGDEGEALLPEDRYAQMRNVWFLPSVATLVAWMKRCGYQDIKVVDVSVTTTEEQRSTDWMQFHSLEQFLDADDHTKTVEGYPAPKRVVIIAEAP
ncbi:MAG: tRNA 5-methoxyuridine(34)/uridine 5-oxyacetic acid(34) synthase CmoB [Gammaproteobacteria bacterium]|nr:tRNA 5-methoxyuridine(34)/uridine 5-oxyacetic acid(34) synthase CmoB [Gammaproteobacteria bacterium]